MDPSKPAAALPADWKPGTTPRMDPQPALYQDYNTAYHPPPEVNPNQSAYPYGSLYGQPYQVPYQGGPAVLIPPPVFATSGAESEPTPNLLAFSIFTMLFCCFPLGAVALNYTIKAQNARRAGDRDEAEEYSGKALYMNKIALSTGVILISISATLTILLIHLNASKYPL
ncbi:proline-rich transmembrane protein 1-like [Astyanax mexicanus]|uniref:Proline-rich transmembrane protein 1-like n=1 Tax=Astyanax mexicanus TaxID=7994 RepID=A0A8T2MNW8_ASTMX|nr:proline-rich transmembrane protein 1-like [Astyanax mexicanus]